MNSTHGISAKPKGIIKLRKDKNESITAIGSLPIDMESIKEGKLGNTLNPKRIGNKMVRNL